MTMIRLMCNLTIHLAQAIRDTLDQRKRQTCPICLNDSVGSGMFDPDGPPEGYRPYLTPGAK